MAAATPNWLPGVTATLPGNAYSNPNVTLNSLSCASPGNCTAVGSYYIDSSGDTAGLILVESAGTWHKGIPAPLPSGAAATPFATLSSVSCRSVGNCTAVGNYYNTAGAGQGLILTEVSGKWTARRAALPSDANSTDPSVFLNSVSCSSAGNCAAVGTYHDASQHNLGLLLTESSSKWSTAEAPLPNPHATDPQVSLNSVSCTGAGDCSAVGMFSDGTKNRGLLLTQTAGTWSAEAANVPNATGSLQLHDVSCSSPGNCAATGWYYDTSHAYQGLLVSQYSGTWAPSDAKLPADVNNTTASLDLNSVSCPSNGRCTAVGYYTDTSGYGHGLVVSELSGTWGTAQAATPPANGGTNPQLSLYSVSCPRAPDCSAIGTYTDKFAHNQIALVSKSSGTWRAGQEARLPPSAASDPSVGASAVVTCVSEGRCAAIDTYVDGSGNGQGVLLDARPARPGLTVSAPKTAKVKTPIPAPAISAHLSGGVSPIGRITFRVFGPQKAPPSACQSGGKTVGMATVSGNGIYHPAAAFTPKSSGNYWWYAAYSGDVGDIPAASKCGAGLAETIVK